MDALGNISDYDKIKEERRMFHKRAVKLHLKNKKLAKEKKKLTKMIQQINYLMKKQLKIQKLVVNYVNIGRDQE